MLNFNLRKRDFCAEEKMEAAVCGTDNWFVHGQSCYKAFSEAKTFDEAQQVCDDEGQGQAGWLAMFSSVEQQEMAQQRSLSFYV